MIKLLVLACGGALGAILRYCVAGIPHTYVTSIFPWGTLSVNIIGSFLIGFFWGMCEHITITPNARVFIFVGFLGAFTTFSTYSLENFHLLRDGEIKYVVFNVMLSNAGGILAVFLGFFLLRSIMNVIQ